MTRYKSVLETIGQTPLIRLDHFCCGKTNVYAKVESFNPAGSIKDRMALAMIEAAERAGDLSPGQTVIEATSGNTGIALAMVCASKGYPLVIVMAESFSLERRKLLRFLGASVVLTPASEKGMGMLKKAKELADTHGYFLCQQFDNEVNAEAHEATTAREIIEDMQGDKVDYFVTGFGTGGTLKGVAAGLKKHDTDTQIIAVEPDNSPMLGSTIGQERDDDGYPVRSHPHFRPHLMQGWSPDFISSLTESAIAMGYVDQIYPIGGKHAMKASRTLARKEGLFVGTTSGATLAVAADLAKTVPSGSNIVCVLADTGERYLSTPLFDSIEVDMNDEELALSKSTPGYQFETTTVVTQSLPTEVDEVAHRFVVQAIDQNKVVMFSLEWCEFCWAARKLFRQLGVDYKSVDLDSVPMQRGDLGVNCRAVLHQLTGSPTIPQIFVDGKLIGGCSELFAEFESGELSKRYELADITFNPVEINVSDLLPGWVHPRGEVA